MITMSLREALAIQARQVEHYKRHRADLAEHMASITHVDGLDLDQPRPVIEVNQYVPRGEDIECACGLEDGGGA